MSSTPDDPPERRPPRGVPRWLWPPPGARVREVVLGERLEPGGGARYRVVRGVRPAGRHLLALLWLLDEHARPDGPPAPPAPRETRVVLAIARTEMTGGRVGHAYAIDGLPLSDPRAHEARGVLWRWIEHALPAEDGPNPSRPATGR